MNLMKTDIYQIQKLADELKKAFEFGNKKRVQQLIDEMILFCNQLKENVEETKKVFHGIHVERINQIMFLYKPILKKDYYEGNYLEEFARQRTYELQSTKALDIHNQFWQSYEVIRGNVFGSLPMELIRQDSIKKLKKYGWKEAMVDILEIKERKCTHGELAEYCGEQYGYFIIVHEKSTGSELILHYHI
ncbi:MAG TPA: hypothetical protein GX503_02525 [Clostridiales bacterium]|nr:hypothetical protein [Clostridiales bacterium]